MQYSRDINHGIKIKLIYIIALIIYKFQLREYQGKWIASIIINLSLI